MNPILLYILFTIIFLTGLGLVGWLLSRHFLELRNINVESIPQEKAQKVKNRILKERLIVNLKRSKELFNHAAKPVLLATKNSWNQLYNRVIELDQKRLQQRQPLNTISKKQKINEHLDTARAHFDAEEFTQAETELIKALELDSQNLDVYTMLADIYQENRDYRKTRETMRYIIKVLLKNKKKQSAEERRQLARTYADLGEVYEQEKKPEQALKQFQLALEIEPANPRFLDLLLKISILLENKELAWQAYNRLQDADPDNQKLAELKSEIEEIP